MRKLSTLASAIFTAALFLPGVAVAQDDIDAEIEAALAAADDASGVESTHEDLPEIGEDQLAVFIMNRGFYFASDLGVFMTFGGVIGHSQVQPHLAIKAGFDINDFLGVQLVLSSGYVSNNPISKNDLPGAGGRSAASYGLFNAGGELVGSIRPTARFAIEPRVGGGITRINPQLTDPGNISATLPAIAPHVVGGIDFKYLTLLTNFTAGLSLTGYYIIGPNIPAAAVGGVVRYTF